jgi:hypothetical protein|tara:strand:+ start:4606 stop:5031 length:426 start_codon:yes stop_codon:yes gene_type:complete
MVSRPHPTGRFGGVKKLEDRLRGRSAVIAHNKEGIAQSLVDLARANLTDVIEWDEQGNVKVKASKEIPDAVASAIKKVKVTRSKDGQPTLEIEMHDKVSVLRVLAKSAGLLEVPQEESQAPSVVGITMHGPDVVQVREEKK